MTITLTQKLMLLVILSLLALVGLFLQMDALQSEAEREFKGANDSRKITEACNQISVNVYELIDILNDEKLTETTFTGNNLVEIWHSFKQQYKLMKRILKNDANKQAIINASEKAVDESYEILKDLRKTYRGETPSDKRRDFKKRLRSLIPKILSDEMIVLGREARSVSERSPENQAQIRLRHRQTLLAYALLYVIMAVIFAWLFVNHITRRLHVMTDNAYRLASGMPLNTMLSGGDEIAALDRVFHKMAEELQHAARRERAVLDNAQDLICSLDQNGKFLAVNPACLSILGYRQDELLGSHYIDLVHEDDVSSSLEATEAVMDGCQEPIETRMICHDGSIINTSWRVRWSPEERTFFCVMHDITAQKQAERMKQEVVAMITHDLRTPLAVIENFLEMLDSDAFGQIDDRGKRLLMLADRSTDRMMGLINDLLDIEKIKAGMMELDKSDVPVQDIFEEAAESLSGWAADHGVALKCRQSALIIRADRNRVCRVVANLVSNAVKYSPPQTEVEISAEICNDNVAISVRDQGRGIPKEKVAAIFDRFQQVRSVEDQKTGSGLGLAICKAIVELHGGTIAVQSDEGKGSVFKFEIPRAT